MWLSTLKKSYAIPTQTLQRYLTNIKRSSAIQQGLLNISIFLISLSLLSVVTYFFVQNALATRTDTNLQQNMTLLMQRESDDWDDDDDDDDYRPAPKTLEQVKFDKEFFLVFPQRDLRLPSNKIFRETGYSTHELVKTQKHSRSRYRVLVEHKGGQVFVVAENNDNDLEILQIVMKSYLLNGVIALILTALLVIFLANRSHRQIRRIEHVLEHAAQGDLKQRVGSTEKMNDLGHVGAQIDTMLSRLETSVSAMTDISANIAHELKTPISRLRHDLITALEQTENGQDAEVALNDAYEESSHITETFDALLRIAQIEGGARRSNFTALDLQTVVSNVVDIFDEVAEDSGMTLSLSQPASTNDEQAPVTVNGDKELLVQMLANLIENSILYCPEGTAISIGCEAEAGKVKLTVADNGPGIPEEDREKVFQRLYRGDKSRTDKRGTGLGLSLVKAIVELHGAEIELLDNTPGVRVEMVF